MPTAGVRASTLVVHTCAIRAIHLEHDYPDPTKDDRIKNLLRGVRRSQAGDTPSQARGLTFEMMSRVRAKTNPKEHSQLVTLALCSVMRDGMLRISEAAAVRWEDITKAKDGSGRLRIPKSKNDPFGIGYVVYLSPCTMKDLQMIKRQKYGRVFRMSTRTIVRRIQAACKKANLPGGFRGHSPRVGMAQDLAANGASVVEMQLAGRWRSPVMPARYARNQSAARGAVAKLYKGMELW